MANDGLDEELAEGLKQAKRGPRNFVMIAKGSTPLKLIVRKKKIRDGDVMKAKTEAKGNLVVVGTLAVNGVDYAFQVLEEPSIKPTKIKELIAEQTELTAKPRWEVVRELADIGDDDESPETESTEAQAASPSAGVSPPVAPPAPPPPPRPAPPGPSPATESADSGDSSPPAANSKQLLAAMNKLAPQIQAAVAAEPGKKQQLVGFVAAFQDHLKSDALADAKAVLAELVGLLKTLGSAPTAGPSSGVSLVRLGKARVEWISVRNEALAGIRRLRSALEAEFGGDAEQLQPLNAALAKLDEGIDELEAELPDQLDAVLNADADGRPALVAVARRTLDRLTTYLNTDEVMLELDDNEVIEGLRVVGPVQAKLAEISAALG